MNVGIETVAAQFLFLGIFVSNVRYCFFAVLAKSKTKSRGELPDGT
jgi:hypothetical protein